LTRRTLSAVQDTAVCLVAFARRTTEGARVYEVESARSTTLSGDTVGVMFRLALSLRLTDRTILGAQAIDVVRVLRAVTTAATLADHDTEVALMA
jgi:hypothetical protein